MTRNPLLTGALGGGVLTVLLAAVAAVPQLAFNARTDSYAADFSNVAGLRPGSPVDVAGVPAGRVTGVALAGGHVRVTFRLDRHQPLGSTTSAAIKLATILGTRYLAIQPTGPGAIPAGATIPVQRTSSPYSLAGIASQAAATASQLNLPMIQRLVGTMSQLVPDNPALIGRALTGVTAATGMISQDNAQLDQLLRSTQSVSSTLLGQQRTLVTLLGDAKLVVQTLAQRRSTIATLVSDLDTLTRQVSTFLAGNQAILGPMLARLHSLSARLSNDEQALSETLSMLAPTANSLANASGNGPWGDVEGPAGPLPDNLICAVGLLQGCR